MVSFAYFNSAKRENIQFQYLFSQPQKPTIKNNEHGVFLKHKGKTHFWKRQTNHQPSSPTMQFNHYFQGPLCHFTILHYLRSR